MDTIGIRELKANLSGIVDRSARGEVFRVSRHGKPIALMLPLDFRLESLILAQSADITRLQDQALENLRRGEFVEYRRGRAQQRAEEQTSSATEPASAIVSNPVVSTGS